MANILLIGATGDVGHGIARVLVASGHNVLAVGRNEQRLNALSASLSSPHLQTLLGSIEDEAHAAQLQELIRIRMPQLDAVVTSVNLPMKTVTLHTLSLDEVTATLRGNVGMHFVAAKTLVPMLRPGGLYLGIGGGMADFVGPGTGLMSMCQAAQRNLFRSLAIEFEERELRFRELLVCSMVAGNSNRDQAHPKWITDEEIGRYVRAILDQPEKFTETLLYLKSKTQVAELG